MICKEYENEIWNQIYIIDHIKKGAEKGDNVMASAKPGIS